MNTLVSHSEKLRQGLNLQDLFNWWGGQAYLANLSAAIALEHLSVFDALLPTATLPFACLLAACSS